MGFQDMDKTLKLGLGEVRQARALVQRLGDAREPQQQATVMGPPLQKINLISCGPMAHVSDIKLIRTDTTLDLSQKAEKVKTLEGIQ
ncbi:Vacuolar ATP synthase catalytic subunit-related / V-ATPase-related / vacuolar proton pump-related [Theobroma cacao]|uniref:Vacuolar ATP synthase catalytic subunit-related / V-ATPase-related / vacuolar proton pump-related n=1 Tax=Theobroma cacao TaxID=3641 RepID=A0A061F208_THECC|nr:Vacuolar ATP synthase catalytic subunit-related / V-ATPase-related / vacuolar proton pump-related [Theobroma cacao]